MKERGGAKPVADLSSPRRARRASAAVLEKIAVLVVEAANDNGAVRGLIEKLSREPLNPVDALFATMASRLLFVSAGGKGSKAFGKTVADLPFRFPNASYAVHDRPR